MSDPTNNPEPSPPPGEPDPFIGQTIAGRYVVTGCIGRGGMGAVYRARQHPLGRDVALKVIRADLTHNPDIARRFEREARAIARLADPHIVVVHDFGVSDGVLFLALELLNGVPLGVRLRDAGALPVRSALQIARDVLVGLDVAHAAGVVHRDLKPDNIMLVRADGRDDYARILDFGIARIVGAPDGTMTSSQVVLGTPGYVAPEVIMGGMSDDPRTDLYAVGIMLWEMLAGHAPFVATTPSAILVAQASHDAPSLSSVAAHVPDDVTELVRRLTARRADERPASAKATIELIDGLLGIAASTGAPTGSLGTAVVTGGAFRSAPSSQTLVLGSSAAPAVEPLERRATPQTASLSLLAGGVATPMPSPFSTPASTAAAPPENDVVRTLPTTTLSTGSIAAAKPVPRIAIAAAAGLAVLVAVVALATRSADVAPMPVAIAAPTLSAPAMATAMATPTTTTVPVAPAAAPTPPEAAPIEVPPPAAALDAPAPKPAPALAPKPAPKPTVLAKATVKASSTATTATEPAPPAPSGPPPLTSALVKQAFQQSVGKASACTNTNIKLAASGPGLFIDHCPSYKTLDGARQVALTVAPDGSVVQARFTDAATNDHRLGACVLKSLLAWKLLPFAGTEPVEIMQRVTFEPCIPINGKCVF